MLGFGLITNFECPDQAVPHVGFYATRDIQPEEELTYLRTDTEDKESVINCRCGHSKCAGKI